MLPDAERHALLLSHQKLAHKFAYKYQARFQKTHEYSDLYSMALMSIWEASETYEHHQGATFLTYAYTALLNLFGNLSRHWRRPIRRGALTALSLDERREDSDLPLVQLAAVTPPPEAEIAGRELYQLVAEAARRLPARSRRILRRRFEEDETLEVIAQTEGLTRERIRQLENGALEDLRSALRARIPELCPKGSTVSKASLEPRTPSAKRKVARQRALT